MEDLQRSDLEQRLKSALKEHQHEGLHMVGGVEQLIPRLENGAKARQKSA